MLARLPDLLWEIKTGVKVTKGNKPEGVGYTLSGLLPFLSLPLIWYSLYQWPA